MCYELCSRHDRRRRVDCRRSRTNGGLAYNAIDIRVFGQEIGAQSFCIIDRATQCTLVLGMPNRFLVPTRHRRYDNRKRMAFSGGGGSRTLVASGSVFGGALAVQPATRRSSFAWDVKYRA